MDITCCYNCSRIKLTIYGSTLLEILRQIDITRALLMELEAALVEEEGFMVDGGYGAEHREGDGWLELLGMWRLRSGNMSTGIYFLSSWKRH